MEALQHLLHYMVHIDTYLVNFVGDYGSFTYFVLFAIIFCETGLVITPFLPGDSLLFAAGSIAAHPSEPLNLGLLFALLALASILGNKLNYLIGWFIGPKVFTAKKIWLFNRRHLQKAHAFYEKHGGKTIILARFLPIIRTFAPFVAGVGYMSMLQFTFYNILSGIIWVGSLLGAGYFLGTLPIVKENFSLVIYGIIIVTLLPPILTFFYQRFRSSP